VLAVGDAEFQKKALGKMKSVSEGEGRTVLFVSHNMTAISNLCDRGILMSNGFISKYGNIETILEYYVKENFENIYLKKWKIDNAPGNEFVRITEASLFFDDKILKTTDSFSFSFVIFCFRMMEFNFSFVLKNSRDEIVFNSISESKKLNADTQYTGRLVIPGNLLNDGHYKIDLYFVDSSTVKSMFSLTDLLVFEVSDNRKIEMDWVGKWAGVIRPNLNFTIHD
jgi:lipopolysaccharide transport system ATP-binding protein